MNLVKKYDAEFPERHFKDFLEYINLSEENFWKKVNDYRSPHLWKKEKGRWIIKHTVYDQ